MEQIFEFVIEFTNVRGVPLNEQVFFNGIFSNRACSVTIARIVQSAVRLVHWLFLTEQYTYSGIGVFLIHYIFLNLSDYARRVGLNHYYQLSIQNI